MNIWRDSNSLSVLFACHDHKAYVNRRYYSYDITFDVTQTKSDVVKQVQFADSWMKRKIAQEDKQPVRLTYSVADNDTLVKLARARSTQHYRRILQQTKSCCENAIYQTLSYSKACDAVKLKRSCSECARRQNSSVKLLTEHQSNAAR